MSGREQPKARRSVVSDRRASVGLQVEFRWGFGRFRWRGRRRGRCRRTRSTTRRSVRPPRPPRRSRLPDLTWALAVALDLTHSIPSEIFDQ